MLGNLICCTLVVPRFAATVEAWQHWLDYRLIARGHVSAEQSRVWGAEAMAGRAAAVLGSNPGGPPYLRLIESAQPAPGAPSSGHAGLPALGDGWNAVEIAVADIYSLARDLAGSPFRILVAPRPIPYDPRIHAMQVVGPGGELLYLTQLPTHETPLGLLPARQRVDRPFIAILGGPVIDRMLDFYRTTFGNETLPGVDTVIQIVNDSFGLAPGHRTPLGVVRLAPGFLLEVDQYPPAAAARLRAAGQLPPGFAMVTLEVTGLGAAKLTPRAPPTALFEVPYDGARVSVVEGAAGEWIELVEHESAIS
jgi:hypothetical protein